MKAVILCGGMGTRLREHTEVRPKPMVEVGNSPILLHIMRIYAHAGIRDFVLCLGYKGHVIKQYFLEIEAMRSDFTIAFGERRSIEYHGSALEDLRDWRVTFAETGESALTGERILRAARYLDDETFCVTYGDGVADIDLKTVVAYHRSHGKLATMLGVRPQSRFGEIDQQGGVVQAFNEKPQTTQGLINGGFFCFEPEFLKYLRQHPQAALEREPLERCVADGELRVYEHAGFWHCMDTHRDWENLEQMWAAGNPPWRIWR
jgi:glucose-1-phosphate cytidylyltransferase